jgi:hypothetical protein
MQNTPLPYSFATNRGTAAKLKFNDIDAPMHSASSNTEELPRNTVCISKNEYNVHYRIQHSNWSYTKIDVPIKLNNNSHSVWLTGGSPSMDSHNDFMETVKYLHPMVMQLFSS